MGLLVDGEWHTDWYDTKSTKGRFVRKDSSFRNWITSDGSPGPSGEGGFPAEPGRYHLYVSMACPWAHRTLIFRRLKGLEEMISVSVVNAYMGDEGWTFDAGDDVVPDTVNDKTRLHEIYTLARPDYTGRVTVPVLWDKKRNAIVSNESSEIIRMFNSAFDDIGALPGDYYPETLRGEIDALNDFIYPNVNNGVYRAGFASSQAAYDEALTDVFEMLDELEARLTGDYLFGDAITETDIRAFVTLIRFDAAYHGLFKTNRRQIADYPRLAAYMRRILRLPGIAETVDLDHIKRGYYSIKALNPPGIVPEGPRHVAELLDSVARRHSSPMAQTAP